METPSFELGRSVSDNLDLWLVSGMGAAFMGGLIPTLGTVH